MKFSFIFLILFSISSCTTGQQSEDPIKKYYRNNSKDQKSSISHGKVSDGSLEHGRLVPYFGDNYSYFDTTSYFSGRAFLHEDVLDITLKTYEELQKRSNRFYRIMECSNKAGGRLLPHKTHQNGTSIDFMMPLVKKGKPYYDLDTTGVGHYWLSFNDNGEYSEDKSVSIDFETIAQHILILDRKAREQGWKVKKVIIKIELKDELYNTPSGKKLKAKGIYVVQGLTKMINALHDEHYHIDFAKI